MATFYECRICGSYRIPYEGDDLCVFCLASNAAAKLPETKERGVDRLLGTVFPEGLPDIK
jgi:hypothetical protein